MKHLNLYEHFFYGREDGEEVSSNQSSGFSNNSMGQLFMDRLPRGIKSELPRQVKDKLVSLNTSSLHVIDEEIQKLEFIIKKYNLDYHSDLRPFWNKVSALSSSTEEQVVSFFKSMLDYALRITVFKDYSPIHR